MIKISLLKKLLTLSLAAVTLCGTLGACASAPTDSGSVDADLLTTQLTQPTQSTIATTKAPTTTLPTQPTYVPPMPDTENWTADASGSYAAYSTLIHDVTIDDSTSANDPPLPPLPAGETRLGYYEAKYAAVPPTIDGQNDDACWATVPWATIDQAWGYPIPADFTGRYKIVWNGSQLYYLVEITDDTLMAPYPDPLVDYYNNDCCELFIDENESGGDHTYNYNAFAYHCSIFGNVSDLGEDQQVHLFNNHVHYSIGRDGDKYLWEFAVTIYGEDFVYGQANTPVQLYAGKDMGFAVAYCYCGLTGTREGFIGGVPILGDDKNVAWEDASVFAHLKLTN